MGNTPFIYSPGQKTKERGKGKVKLGWQDACLSVYVS